MSRIRKRGPVDPRPGRPRRRRPGDLTLAEAHDGRHGDACRACYENTRHYHDTDSAETGFCSGCGATGLRKEDNQ